MHVRDHTVPELLAGAQWVALVHTLGLSPRECDVLRCMFADERVAAIAQELLLSEGTVHTYRERLFRKLGVRSCAQLLAVAFAVYIELNNELSAKVDMGLLRRLSVDQPTRTDGRS